MVSTYTDIQKQIAQLEKKAAAFKTLEAAKIIARMKSQIAEYDLTEADLFGSSTAPKRGAKAAAKAATKTVKPAKPPKYMDPKTGKTWNGHGKPPGWIAGVKPAKRDGFLIANVQAVHTAKAAPNPQQRGERSLLARPAAQRLHQAKPVTAKKVLVLHNRLQN